MENKIYPQHFKGKYRAIKDVITIFLIFLYCGSSWIRYDRGVNLPNQAILIDLPARKLYFFGIEIFPTELYYLTGLLIISAFSLFLVTMVFGRVWCGYTCPHTVFTDIFVKIETFFQGDRNARIKLDSEAFSKEKLLKKLLTHMAWFFVGFLFAFGWVSYFYGAPHLLEDTIHLQVTSGGKAWLLGLTFSTYFFAGFLRTKVCLYMCPYGRFQSAMLDQDSMIVTYNAWRGEPRKNLDISDGLGVKEGDCINCGKCVIACPMGIDIKDGLQIGCIGCGLCIDACDSVMKKILKPLGLISYSSLNQTISKRQFYSLKEIILRPKVIFYTTLLILVCSAIIYSLLTRAFYTMAIYRDRGQLFTTTSEGCIKNIYNLKISKRSDLPDNLNNQGIGKENLKLEIVAPEDLSFTIQWIEDYYSRSFILKNLEVLDAEYRIIIKSCSNYSGQEVQEIKFNLLNSDTKGSLSNV